MGGGGEYKYYYAAFLGFGNSFFFLRDFPFQSYFGLWCHPPVILSSSTVCSPSTCLVTPLLHRELSVRVNSHIMCKTSNSQRIEDNGDRK